MRRLALMMLAALLLSPLLPVRAQDAPVSIDSPQALAAITENPGGTYVLTRDIDMAGIDWVPIAFSGTLDGAGHTLYNLSITQIGQEKANTTDGNLKKYGTYFAALFSVVKGAYIKNLNLLNVHVSVRADKINCFAAGLAGLAEDTVITGCSVEGRVYLYQNRYMCGVAGLVGFGHGAISGCSADVELVLVDGNRSIKCEAFLGGILGAGYFDMEDCHVKLNGYASVHGYVHNGGVIGMYKVYVVADKMRKGYIKGCSVDAHISFFEHNSDRRAYCKAVIGEKLNKYLLVDDNIIVSFDSHETRDYRTDLMPEACASPLYTAEVVPPPETEYGYTRYVCQGCGYAYTDDYVHPIGVMP